MPIVVTHSPSVQTLAKAGYYAGAGEAMRAQQQMASEQRMQERRIQADVIQRQMAMEQQFQGHQMDLNRMQVNNQFQMQQAEREEQMRKRLMQLEHDNDLDRIKRTRDANREAEEQANENAATRDQAVFFRGAASQMRDQIQGLLDAGMSFTPEDEQAYKAKLKAMDAVMKDKTLKPWPRAQALYEISQELPLPTIKPPSPQEIVKESVVWMPDPNDKTGQRKIAVALDRNGAARLLHAPTPEKAEVDNSAKDMQNYQDLYLKVQQSLYERSKKINEKTGEVEYAQPTDAEVRQAIAEIQSAAADAKPVEFIRDPQTGKLIQK